MPYVVSGGRLVYRSTISRKAHGRRHVGKFARRLTKDGDHVTKGARRAHLVTPPDFSLVIVPPGPAATGTHPPRIYGPVARAKGPGGPGAPTVSAFMKGYPLSQPRAYRRAMAKQLRRDTLAEAKAKGGAA